ncbi:hypothetical protein GWK47_031917 [Chionoecetes opilio]|uniref:Uncharacterized protein n=1 Tax=Chionoecetes opilio TaxID=41210 RepID=A0A8J4YUV3_CHIOP|nr:hypothetical protein GWK47_031917 [Chionoecetes opilio]
MIVPDARFVPSFKTTAPPRFCPSNRACRDPKGNPRIFPPVKKKEHEYKQRRGTGGGRPITPPKFSQEEELIRSLMIKDLAMSDMKEEFGMEYLDDQDQAKLSKLTQKKLEAYTAMANYFSSAQKLLPKNVADNVVEEQALDPLALVVLNIPVIALLTPYSLWEHPLTFL